MKAVAVLSCPRCGGSNAEFDLRCLGCGEQLSQKSGSAVLSAAAVPEAAGRQVGGYELLEPLGRGGMGLVYRARQLRSGRIVALKTVALVEAGLLEGIRREIRALSALRHPDIVRILEHGVQDGLPWYAMEVVRGRTLRAWAQRPAEEAETFPAAAGVEPWWTHSLSAPIRNKAPAPGTSDEPPGGGGDPRLPRARRSLREILTLARRLCGPLAYLHGEGLVHRDLKPENVLVREARGAARGRPAAALGEVPVVVDFGLSAAVAGRRGREPFEALGFGAGTVAYMAPEQIQGEALDARADLYSLGCVLYELVTGRRPFQGPSVAEVLEGHLHLAPRPPSELFPEVHKGLDELILRLLAKEPRQRLGHADDVAAALVELGAAGEPFEGGAAAGKRAPKPRAYLYRSALAGREEPMRRLEAALSALQEQGAGGLLLVGGESGVGKTRLLLELSRQAGKRGVRVLAGECVPGAVSREPPRSSVGARLASPSVAAGSALPLQVDAGSAGSGSAAGAESIRVARGRSRRSPLLAGTGGPLEALRRPLQALADVCREQGLEATERLLGRRGKVLALYEPALRDLPGQAGYPEPAELPPAAARLRLFGYLTETLAALAGTGQGSAATQAVPASPLLLLLDDLQWSDALTLDWLQYWMRARSTTPQQAAPLLIVGTYRSEEVDTSLADAGAPHASPLRRLVDVAGIVSIGLDRLEEAAVGAIVGDMLALEPPPALFVRHLARHSEGNPFFVAEYLRVMIEPGAEARAPLLWRDTLGQWQVLDPAAPEATADPYEALALPTTLQELVARRLEGLGRDARRVAEAAAVLGRESDPAVLGPMLGLSEPRQFDALNELARRQVLEVPTPGRLRFVHDQIREVAYTRLRSDRRKRLHRAAAEAIVGADGGAAAQADEHLADLGRHREEAGQPDMARPCYLAAARHATTRYDNAEAERLYRAYLRLVEEPTAESVAARDELGGKVLYLCGRSEEALCEHGRALEEARLIGDRHSEARVLQQQGRVHWFAGRLEEARQIYEQALVIFREVGDRHKEGVVLGNMGLLFMEQGRSEEALQLCEQALASHRKVGDRHNEGVVLGNLGTLYGRQGRRVDAQPFYEQALAVHREVGNRMAEGVMLGNLGLLQVEQGRPEEAQQLYEQALAICREVGNRPGEGTVLGNLGLLHIGQGRPEGARLLFEQALDLHREVGNRRSEGIVLLNLANLYGDQGWLEESRPFYAQALAISREVGDRASEAIVLGNLGGLHQTQGRLEEARQFYEQALDLQRELGNRPSEACMLRNLGMLHMEQGRPEEARQLLEQALAIHCDTGNRHEEGLMFDSLACLARLGTGDLAMATRWAAQGEEHLEIVGEKPALCELLCERGHIDVAAGRSGRGLLERALDLQEASGAGPKSGLGKAVSKLRRAVEAFEAGEQHRLFRGELLEDIPEGLRRHLEQSGQLRSPTDPRAGS